MPTSINKCIISISVDFLKSFADIPQSQQKKIREFVQQFQINPEMPGGRHYEQLQNTSDSSLRSVRIDLNYRAIVAKPEGNVFLLLWVAKHDDAYQWATRKRIKIHPQTGGIQLVKVQMDEPQTNMIFQTVAGLFSKYSKEQLGLLGIPEELLTQTYSIQTEDDLLNLEDQFPQEAYNSLFLLACGEPYENILAEYNRKQDRQINTSDFAAALNNDDSRSRFTVVSDSVELEALLNAPLEQWRVFLHPLQKKFVEMDASGPVRILGGAGTGKTVVALHRARHLVRNVFAEKNDRILFTTFTKNLSADIFASLQQICSKEELDRIDVVNLDAWTKNFLECKGIRFQIIDYQENVRRQYWTQALAMKPNDCSLPDQFFFDEWKQIIQPQSISSLNEYLFVSRIGRGHRLNRLERKKLWPVWDEYRTLLLENNFLEIQDLYRDATVLLKESAEHFYRGIIVDEGQDFSSLAYSMIRAMIQENKNDIFIVGDAHQRIYGHQAVLGKSDIKITGRSRKLKVNYRTTEQIYHFAASVLTGLDFDDLNGQEDALGQCQSLTRGPCPEIRCFPTISDEKNFLKTSLIDFQAKGVDLSSVCIAARTNELINQYAVFLESQGIPVCRIKTDVASDPRKKGVRLGTMHRIKGIEFDYVFLPSICDGIFPSSRLLTLQENATDQNFVLQSERSLFYVALTRARKAVFISGYGKLSSFVSIPHNSLNLVNTNTTFSSIHLFKR